MDFGSGKPKMGLNLLPEEYKKKIANRTYCNIGIAVAILVLLIVGGFAYYYFSLSNQESELADEVQSISSLKTQISSLQEEKKRLENDDSDDLAGDEASFASSVDYFDFDGFMKLIYDKIPIGNDFTLISVDSQDRLVEDSVEGSVGNTSDTQDGTTAAKQAADANVAATTGDGSTDTSSSESADVPAGYTTSEGVVTTPITSKSIFLRGYSSSVETIAQYIKDIASSDYVSNVQLTSVQNRTDGDMKKVKVFEIIIELKNTDTMSSNSNNSSRTTSRSLSTSISTPDSSE